MTTDLHLQGETTKKYDLPLTHLEYSYVEKCTNVKELEKILKLLRSGDEGRYPELERFTEDRIQTLCPKSRLLRKENPVLRPGDGSINDWQSIEQDLQSWTNDMNSRDTVKGGKGAGDSLEDEKLPPVRSTNVILEGNKQKRPEENKKGKRVMPRDYKEWDKVDIDAEIEKVDKEVKVKPVRSQVNGIDPEIDGTGLSKEEKQFKSEREKDKGNEAYHAGDYDESVMYYCRSLSLMPNLASYNNRALAYLKLEKWDEAINDCNSVLNKESENIKAMLRRGTAYKSKKEFVKAKADFGKVLKMESNNKKAETLMKEVADEMLKQEKAKKQKGKRMAIEEVEDGSDEDLEQIEVEKPKVNGFSSHEKQQNKAAQEKVNSRADVQLKEEISKIPSSSSAKKEKSVSKPKSSEPPQKDKHTSSKTDRKDTPVVCSVPESQISNKESTEPVKSSSTATPSINPVNSAHHSSDSSSLPQAAVVSSEKISQPSTANSPSTDSVSASKSASSNFSRPVIVQSPLPPQALKLKEEGNTLFRTGQYGAAADAYTKAMTKIQSNSEQHYNLSLLYSNRAACNLKTGNCNIAISDCEQSLQLVPHAVKALLRRAAAYENKERYSLAYVDYRHIISVDNTCEQAHQGSSRCQAILQQVHGSKEWRDKIPALQHVQPWEIPIIVDKDSQHSKMENCPNSASTCQSQPPPPSAPSKPKVSMTKEAARKPSETSNKKPHQDAKTETTKQPKKKPTFEELKAAGNQHVQKGEFKLATACYTNCIAMCPEQVASYTNRALCYLKLEKPTEAEADCNKALTLQPDNAKALYRRALARKKLVQYKACLQDLIELLKLEPKNSAAKKEIDVVKMMYKEELNKLKQKKTEQESKARRRMKIEEVDDDEEEEKPARPKQTEKKFQPKNRGAKSSQPASSGKSKSNHHEKKPGQTKESTVMGQPVAPPIAPRLMKTTPYEFCQAWNSLKPCQGIQPYAEILRQISPSDLPSVISNKLDGQMLQIIVRSVNEEIVLKGEVERGYQILNYLCKVPRFSTVSMFMSTKEKKEVSSVLDILSESNSSAYTKEDIIRLKKEYSVK